VELALCAAQGSRAWQPLIASSDFYRFSDDGASTDLLADAGRDMGEVGSRRLPGKLFLAPTRYRRLTSTFHGLGVQIGRGLAEWVHAPHPPEPGVRQREPAPPARSVLAQRYRGSPLLPLATRLPERGPISRGPQLDCGGGAHRLFVWMKRPAGPETQSTSPGALHSGPLLMPEEQSPGGVAAEEVSSCL